MLTKQNHQFLKHFRARMLIGVAIEVGVVALMMQNREIWFGIPVAFTEQAVIFLITSILLFWVRHPHASQSHEPGAATAHYGC